mmetsp:Transcript_6029/g.15552  ORF Transcript_6029/g.15552 Transcript_6029/m.15552 type:complete len:342 (+) Transcript_6029:39-1064(+)|eukprot:CAMPEP_0197491824 /NCGR_PEP_ID=MMETSP1311-20131121/5960_1 /TAXON_ID=464262 /ORGANISM="Genus nov. species nov., Strain RCC856" /LENGTH=341 /DNA_ID=CAMNT_0043036531 /DNA_START=79 /DNA_END=1104 /DNA_ORIENTATION=-
MRRPDSQEKEKKISQGGESPTGARVWSSSLRSFSLRAKAARRRHPSSPFRLGFNPFFVLDLWRQVVSDVSHVGDLVFHNDWQVLDHAEGDLGGERGRLGEGVEVPQGEAGRDWLGDLNLGPLLLLVGARVWPAGDVGASDVSLSGEPDPLLGHVDVDGVADGAQVPAEPLELGRGHLHHGGVRLVGHKQVLVVYRHRLHLKVADLVVVLTLEQEGDVVGLILALDGDDVVVAGALDHLHEVADVQAHGDVPVAPVVLEPLGLQQDVDQGDVARVHGLERKPIGTAVEVALRDDVLDGIKHLFEKAALKKSRLKHDCRLCVGLSLPSLSPRLVWSLRLAPTR